MAVFAIDPLHDPRWVELLLKSERASVFHNPGWLGALKNSYGYKPVAYTTTEPGVPRSTGWVFRQITSWLTGRRLVSLPFSDHCDPLAHRRQDLEEISAHLTGVRHHNHWRHLECRFESNQGVPLGFDGTSNWSWKSSRAPHIRSYVSPGPIRN